jgi:hypothetical protein
MNPPSSITLTIYVSISMAIFCFYLSFVINFITLQNINNDFSDGPISGNSITATLNALKRIGPLPVPCITSISGAIMVVLPNIGGLCIYSPVLNNNMIGAKSLELCNSILEKFNIK